MWSKSSNGPNCAGSNLPAALRFARRSIARLRWGPGDDSIICVTGARSHGARGGAKFVSTTRLGANNVRRMRPIEITDDRGQLHRFARPPQRIVSLVPSDTYTLARLGVGDRLVGRTDYCDAPADLASKVPSVGGTKDADVEKILALSPDVVLVNQEENTLRTAEKLLEQRIPTVVSFPRRATDSLAQIARLARLLGTLEPDARDRVKWAYAADRELRSGAAKQDRTRVFLPIWMDPLMTIQRETFISDTLEHLGLDNVFSDRDRKYPLAADLGRAEPQRVQGRDVRYPRITLEELAARRPQLILLPDEPHPFTEADADVFRGLDLGAKVLFIRGKSVMWPGLMALEGMRALATQLDAAIAELRHPAG